jgi:AI-2 transport protein TqsA
MVESAFGLLLLALAFVAPGMAEIRAAQRRIRTQLGDQADRIFEIGGEVAVAFRRFFAAKSLTSLLTGLASFGLATALGLDLAIVWGFLAFLLEYVPTIGSMLAVVPPTLFAFMQSDGLRRPLIVLASFSVLQVVMGNFVDPRIEGRILAISPFAVLLAIVFWGWLWGVPGAFLGVPLTVALLIACRHFERARWVADLLEDRRERLARSERERASAG